MVVQARSRQSVKAASATGVRLSRPFTLLEFSATMAVALGATIAGLTLIELSSYLYRPLTAAMLGAAMALASIWLIRIVPKDPDDVKEDPRFALARVLPISIALLVTVVAAFSMLCEQLAFYLGGFSDSQSGYWQWLRFGVTWILDNVLAGSPQVFGWSLSGIHATSFWSQTLVFIYNVALAGLALVVVVRYLRFLLRVVRHHDLPQSSKFAGFIARRLAEFVLTVLWVIPAVSLIITVTRGDLRVDLLAPTVLSPVPVALGIWLVGQSARALAIPGLGNRIGSCLGIVGGSAVIYLTWSLMRGFFPR